MKSFFLGTILSLSTYAFAAEPVPRVISVSGECMRRLVPNRGMVTVTADALAKETTEATKKATAIYEKVRQKLKALGLKDFEMETAEYTVREEKEWVNNKQASRGFRTRIGLHVRTSEISKMGEVLRVAHQEGVSDVSNMQTYLSVEERLKEEEACLTTALQSAKAKADTLVKAGGAKLGGLYRVDEEQSPQQGFEGAGYGAQPLARMAMKSEADTPQIEAGTLILSKKIQVQYEIK